MFEIFAVVDISEGKVVRLKHGEFNNQTVYSTDVVSTVQKFVDMGFDKFHIIDLDGARFGKPQIEQTVKTIKQNFNVFIQVGGGIKTESVADFYLSELKVDRIIIGSAAFLNPELVEKLIKKYGSEKIVVSIDIKDETLMFSGWKASLNISFEQMVEKLKSFGLKNLIITNILKDGTKSGLDKQFCLKIKQKTNGLNVILAGGVTFAQDINFAKQNGFKGVVLGKRIYESDINILKEID